MGNLTAHIAALRTRKVTFMLPRPIADSACSSSITKALVRSRRKIRASCGRQVPKNSEGTRRFRHHDCMGEIGNDKNSRAVCGSTDGRFFLSFRSRSDEKRRQELEGFVKAY